MTNEGLRPQAQDPKVQHNHSKSWVVVLSCQRILIPLLAQFKIFFH